MIPLLFHQRRSSIFPVDWDSAIAKIGATCSWVADQNVSTTGDAITSWIDTVSAIDASQGTADDRPTYQNGASDYQYSIMTDGTTDHFDIATTATMNVNTSDLTLIVATSLDDLTADQTFIKRQGAGGWGLEFLQANNQANCVFTDGVVGASFSSANNAINDTNWHVIYAEADRTSQIGRIYIDNVQSGSDADLSVTGADINDQGVVLHLLKTHNNARYVNGKTYAIIFIKGILTPTNRTGITNLLLSIVNPELLLQTSSDSLLLEDGDKLILE